MRRHSCSCTINYHRIYLDMKTNVLTLRLIYSDVYYKTCHVFSPPCHSVIFLPFSWSSDHLLCFYGFGGSFWGRDVFPAWLKGSGSVGYPHFFYFVQIAIYWKRKKVGIFVLNGRIIFFKYQSGNNFWTLNFCLINVNESGERTHMK